MTENDPEALRVRIRALEAEIDSERRCRQAAEAGRGPAAIGPSALAGGGPSARTPARLPTILIGFLVGVGVAAGVGFQAIFARQQRVTIAREEQDRSRFERVRLESQKEVAALKEELVRVVAACRPTPQARVESERKDEPEAEVPATDEEEAKLVQEAAKQYVAGDLKAAIATARSVLKKNPENKRAWQLLGSCSCLRNDARQAALALTHLPLQRGSLLRAHCARNGISL
jgi:hypothetical protein